ncbi:hypothetical protein M6B38_366040 [Iris pallida]|uniref:Uncharacterized protein n=1 Tax=Iris pallida TaxID=29817 RepID=A0AAX6GGQ8_IRIPA|nr:hypothetical protein M6B38_366040 [Iris pallida]
MLLSSIFFYLSRATPLSTKTPLPHLHHENHLFSCPFTEPLA